MKYTSIVTVGALSVALSAHAAETVLIDGFSFDPRGLVTNPYTDIASNFISTTLVNGSLPVPPAAGTYTGGGRMSGLLNGNSFDTYCVEISIAVGFGTTYTDYNLQSGITGFGSRAANLASLMTWASAAGMPSDAPQSAALQAAVWEVVHETTDGAFSFTSGKLTTTSTNAATQAALTNIESNWATILNTAPTYTVSRLDGTAQDLLVYAPVPENSTLAMMALGLAGVAMVKRQRRAG